MVRPLCLCIQCKAVGWQGLGPCLRGFSRPLVICLSGADVQGQGRGCCLRRAPACPAKCQQLPWRQSSACEGKGRGAAWRACLGSQHLQSQGQSACCSASGQYIWQHCSPRKQLKGKHGVRRKPAKQQSTDLQHTPPLRRSSREGLCCRAAAARGGCRCCWRPAPAAHSSLQSSICTRACLHGCTKHTATLALLGCKLLSGLLTMQQSRAWCQVKITLTCALPAVVRERQRQKAKPPTVLRLRDDPAC